MYIDRVVECARTLGITPARKQTHPSSMFRQLANYFALVDRFVELHARVERRLALLQRVRAWRDHVADECLLHAAVVDELPWNAEVLPPSPVRLAEEAPELNVEDAVEHQREIDEEVAEGDRYIEYLEEEFAYLQELEDLVPKSYNGSDIQSHGHDYAKQNETYEPSYVQSLDVAWAQSCEEDAWRRENGVPEGVELEDLM